MSVSVLLGTSLTIGQETVFFRVSLLVSIATQWFRSEKYIIIGTGKSMSEAFVFASTNPQYEDRLFIELQVQYMKIPSSNLGRTCCVQKLFLTFRSIFVHNMFSPCSAKRRASDKDLPVCTKYIFTLWSLVPSSKIKGEFPILNLVEDSYLAHLFRMGPRWKY